MPSNTGYECAKIFQQILPLGGIISAAAAWVVEQHHTIHICRLEPIGVQSANSSSQSLTQSVLLLAYNPVNVKTAPPKHPTSSSAIHRRRSGSRLAHGRYTYNLLISAASRSSTGPLHVALFFRGVKLRTAALEEGKFTFLFTFSSINSRRLCLNAASREKFRSIGCGPRLITVVVVLVVILGRIISNIAKAIDSQYVLFTLFCVGVSSPSRCNISHSRSIPCGFRRVDSVGRET